MRRASKVTRCCTARFLSNDAQQPNSGTVSEDAAGQWLDRAIDRNVASGRQTQQGADYFRTIASRPELRRLVVDLHQMVGGHDPEQLSAHQRKTFGDIFDLKATAFASDKLTKALNEQSGVKRYMEEGTPTGENYWIEAHSVLSSPAIPSYVKDQVFEDMKRDRPSDGIAGNPPENLEPSLGDPPQPNSQRN